MSLKIADVYHERPKICFQDQEEGEVVLLLLRRHFVTNFTWVLTAVLLILAPIIVFLSPYRLALPILGQLPPTLLIFAVIVWYQFSFGFVLTSFCSWFFNIDLVTDRRLLDVDYWGFLFFNVAETSLGKIQDITYSISGLAQTVFNYGNIYIQTAGTAANFEFTAVASPATAHDLITDIMQEGRVRSQ